MAHFAVIGAGIAGVTTAYALLKRGHAVTVFDRNRYPAMDTSYANGGQLSVSNAEVWNHWSTVFKGIKWMVSGDAPLLLNPRPNWHKYSWLAEFAASIPNYRANTAETVRLALAARKHMYEIAESENLEFDLERRGILHLYHDAASFAHATKVNSMLVSAGLDRHAVSNDDIHRIEPSLQGSFYAGYFTPSDATGDIHKFTRGLAEVCKRLGAVFLQEVEVLQVKPSSGSVALEWRDLPVLAMEGLPKTQRGEFGGVVICAGVGSRRLAASLGDRVNVYPVKGYSITVHLDDDESQSNAPWVSLLDDAAKIVTSRLGVDRFRVAGTAEINGYGLDIRADRIRPLVAWSRRFFPHVGTGRVVPWSGLRPMLPNMLPRVGPGRLPGVYYNTGHGHLGWTLSCATADMVGELIGTSMGEERLPVAV